LEREFKWLFASPIAEGQSKDSTEDQIRLMKKRCAVVRWVD